ncbi:MAG: aldehyde dehydrogenase family protein, partial [Desulfobacter sp.]
MGNGFNAEVKQILDTLGIKSVNYGATTGGSKGWIETKGKELVSYSPINGKPIASVLMAEKKDYETVMTKA